MPDKVLLVCSSTAENIRKAREILCARTPSRPARTAPALQSFRPALPAPGAARRPGLGLSPPARTRQGLQAGGAGSGSSATGRWRSSGAAIRPACAQALRPGLRRPAHPGLRPTPGVRPAQPLPAGELLAARLRRLRPRPWRPARVLPPPRVLLAPLAAAARLLAAGFRLLAQWLLIPVRFLLLLGSVLWLYARRRPRGGDL